METDKLPIVKTEVEEDEEGNDSDNDEEPVEGSSPVTFFLATGVNENDNIPESEAKSSKRPRKEKLKSKPMEIQISPTKIFENESDDDDDDDEMYDECDVDPLQGETSSTSDKLKSTKKTTQVFTCEFCPDMTFPCSKAFTQHRRKEHPDSERVVEVEPNKFLYDDTWGFFLSNNIFTCGTCFTTKKSLAKTCRHIDSVHKNVSLPRRPGSLSNHVSIQVLPNGSTTCPECGKTYSTRQTMLSHLRLHNREKKIICPEPNCGQRFYYKSNMIFHMRIHSGEKQNKCTVCQKTFSIRGDLREHALTHLIKDPRPWKCPIENAAFAWKKGLIEHIKKYHPTGEAEKFECPFEGCDKTFVSKSNYTKHLLSHEKRRRLCDICDTNGKKLYFKTASGLQRHHTKEHHSDTSNKKKKTIRKVDNNEKKKKNKKDKITKDDAEMIKIEIDPMCYQNISV